MRRRRRLTSKTPYRALWFIEGPGWLVFGRGEGEGLEGALPAEAVVEGDAAVRVFGLPAALGREEGEQAAELREAGVAAGGLDVLKRAVGKVAAALEGGGGNAQVLQPRQQGDGQQGPEF